jgi:hypothetical protein
VLIRWKKGDDYHIKYEQFNISKAKTGDSFKYILWRNAKMMGIYMTLQEAKNDALAFIQAEPSIPDGKVEKLLGTRTEPSDYSERKGR